MLGILYCSKSILDYPSLAAFFAGNGIETTCLEVEQLSADSLAGIDVLLNAMDVYYPEEQLPLLVEYFQQGGHIINLCPAPFTVSLVSGQTNHRALRSFTIVDDFHPIEGESASVSTWYGDTASLALTGLTGGVYHMCEQENGKNKRVAHFEHLMDAFDANGNLLAAAILRIVTHKMGSMTLCNFDVATALKSKSGASVAFIENALLKTVHRNLAGTALLTVDAAFSRFTPDEQKDIHISITPFTIAPDKTAELHISVYKDADNTLVYDTKATISLPYETDTWSFSARSLP